MRKLIVLIAIVALSATFVVPEASAAPGKIIKNLKRAGLCMKDASKVAIGGVGKTGVNILQPFAERPLKATVCAPVMVPLRVAAGAGDIVRGERQEAVNLLETAGRLVAIDEPIPADETGSINRFITKHKLDIPVDVGLTALVTGISVHNNSAHACGKAAAGAGVSVGVAQKIAEEMD